MLFDVCVRCVRCMIIKDLGLFELYLNYFTFLLDRLSLHGVLFEYEDIQDKR